MSIFTNKSTVELIPQNEVNSDFGVPLFRSASFNNFDKSKYQNPDGTPNQLTVDTIYESLAQKHKSVFFGSRICFGSNVKIDLNKLSKDEIQGLEWQYWHNSTTKKVDDSATYSLTIYLAMRWIYYKPDYINENILECIEDELKTIYPACYEALQRLPEENVTPQEKYMLEDATTHFISFKGELALFVASQIYRHRAINHTQKSGRYTAKDIKFFMPDEWRKAPAKATQGSIENEFVKEWTTENDNNYKSIVKLLNEWFEANIDKENASDNCGGICKEQARIILSQSQMTTTINTVNLTSLSSILYLRLDKSSQKETRDFAEQLYNIACKEFGEECVDKLIDIQSRLVF